MQFRNFRSSSSMVVQNSIKNDEHSTSITNEKMISSYNIKLMFGKLKAWVHVIFKLILNTMCIRMWTRLM